MQTVFIMCSLCQEHREWISKTRTRADSENRTKTISLRTCAHIFYGCWLRRVCYFLLRKRTHNCYMARVVMVEVLEGTWAITAHLQEMHLFLLAEVEHIVQVDFGVVVVRVAILNENNTKLLKTSHKTKQQQRVVQHYSVNQSWSQYWRTESYKSPHATHS